jgi:hypothetical protein
VLATPRLLSYLLMTLLAGLREPRSSTGQGAGRESRDTSPLGVGAPGAGRLRDG